jgi:nitrite reductase/ring-hydroxylating ferredoxin subunit
MSLMGILDRVADVAACDRFIEPVRRAVQGALTPQGVADFLHGTWLGHPLHPVLVHGPLGSWISAGLLDLAPPLRPAATALIGTGVAAAVPAVANTAALGLYIGSLVARGKGRGTLGRVLSYAGLGVVGGSAAIGGHMSYSQAAGVSHAATAARALTTGWIDLGPLDDLPEGRPALRTGTGPSVAVPLAAVRRGARVDVFIGACSHLSGPLEEGRVQEVRGAQCLVCPLHGSAYDLDSGEPRRGPAANAQEKLEVRVEAGRVMARLPARHR